MVSASQLQHGIKEVVRDLNCDIFLYAGDLDRATTTQLIRMCPPKPRSNALLLLITNGGDPHATYKLTRHFHHRYKDKLILFIPGICKSAGTVMAIGAHDLIMSDHGELGPLDVQIGEPDELGEQRSGLISTQAWYTIKREAFDFFLDSLFELKLGSLQGITTRTATEIAAQLTTGMFEPLVRQIDPLRDAYVRLSMRIAEDYGLRLKTDNVKDSTIYELIYNYPSHGFVIDRKEASELFVHVREPKPAEMQIADFALALAESALKPSSLVLHLTSTQFLDNLAEAVTHEKSDSLSESGHFEETSNDDGDRHASKTAK